MDWIPSESDPLSVSLQNFDAKSLAKDLLQLVNFGDPQRRTQITAPTRLEPGQDQQPRGVSPGNPNGSLMDSLASAFRTDITLSNVKT